MTPHFGRICSLSRNAIAAVIVTTLLILSPAHGLQTFSATDQSSLLKFVNGFRSDVACHEYQAANMQEVFWDETLADWGDRDARKCAVVQLPKSAVTGVAIFMQNYSNIEDLIAYMQRDPVSRTYLMKASFTSMGCGVNMTSCDKHHEIVCYWYPQCGSLFNAFEEGPLACREFRSEASKKYKNLCVLNQALPSPSPVDQKTLSEICAHKVRRKPEQQCSKTEEKWPGDHTMPLKAQKKSNTKSEPTSVMKFLYW